MMGVHQQKHKEGTWHVGRLIAVEIQYKIHDDHKLLYNVLATTCQLDEKPPPLTHTAVCDGSRQQHSLDTQSPDVTVLKTAFYLV